MAVQRQETQRCSALSGEVCTWLAPEEIKTGEKGE
jgi:hypothetical protein